jgi:hypothetical protein
MIASAHSPAQPLCNLAAKRRLPAEASIVAMGSGRSFTDARRATRPGSVPAKGSSESSAFQIVPSSDGLAGLAMQLERDQPGNRLACVGDDDSFAVSDLVEEA